MTSIVVPLTVCAHPVGESEQLFYYSFNEKVSIVTVPGKFMLKKKADIEQKQMEAIVNSFLNKASFDWFNSDICTVQTDESVIDEAIDQLLIIDNVVSVRRVYNTLSSTEYFKNKPYQNPLDLGLIDQVVLNFKDSISDSDKNDIKKSFGLIEFEKNEVFEVCLVPKDVDILDLSNRLFKTGHFKFAYPELICKATHYDDMAVYPNDPYFQYQVALHNTGQTFNGHTGTANADIDAPEAWALTMGSDSIIVAVIDDGVTSNHPDLPNTRQIRLNGSNFGSGDPDDPSPIGNHNHGNACAGIIAATANNGEGIAGIAPLCKIMPVRVDITSNPVKRANAILFAANNGARVISCSWGYDDLNDNLHPCIVEAIMQAVYNNCSVLFAVGNNAWHSNTSEPEDGFVAFPANRKIAGKLAVGASDRYDFQADYSPTDTCVDIVAPSSRSYPYHIVGETLEMWSIDIPGNSGSNPWPSGKPDVPAGTTLPSSGTNYLSYTGHFGGTSFACPVVAGVAALVLSMNSQLSPQAVCNVLTSTAQKVGGYNYVNGRCNEMGYGRVNANNAVWAVCDTKYFVNQKLRNQVKKVTGCDIYMENDTVIINSALQVRARNGVLIQKNFLIDNGSYLDIKRGY